MYILFTLIIHQVIVMSIAELSPERYK